MLGWRFGSHQQVRPGLRQSTSLRVLGMALASVLLVSACASKQEASRPSSGHAEEDSHGAYTPFARSTSARVSQDGSHHVADDVKIGSEHPAAYNAIATTGSAWVHPAGAIRSMAPFQLEYERQAGVGSTATYVSTTPPTTTASAAAKPGAPRPTGARPAPSPTAVARLNLGAGLGASAAAKPGGNGNALTLTDDDGSDDLATIAGRVESIVGQDVAIKAPSGTVRMKLAPRVRIDRDSLGGTADLKPGQFVGAVQTLGGPASSVRLYATGPSTPRPGIVPMVGSRNGQVTTFGSVVTLQFGGLLLNTGGETTTVTLPAGVEILKPAQADASVLAVGAQIIATGTMGADDLLTASAVRVTTAARPTP
jgi:hypothetical protein